MLQRVRTNRYSVCVCVICVSGMSVFVCNYVCGLMDFSLPM